MTNEELTQAAHCWPEEEIIKLIKHASLPSHLSELDAFLTAKRQLNQIRDNQERKDNAHLARRALQIQGLTVKES